MKYTVIKRTHYGFNYTLGKKIYCYALAANDGNTAVRYLSEKYEVGEEIELDE